MPRMSKQEKHFTDTAHNSLVGRTVKEVRYMTEKEADESGWDQRGILIIFDDDSWMVAQSDDEGNGVGALVYAPAKGEQLLFPVFPV